MTLPIQNIVERAMTVLGVSKADQPKYEEIRKISADCH